MFVCRSLGRLSIVFAVFGSITTEAAVSNIPVHKDRKAYYGDLHLHTSYSFDAYLYYSPQVDPDGALRFARGEPGKYLGKNVRRTSPPLDFAAVTDHAEWLGLVTALDDPHSTFSQSALGKLLRKVGEWNRVPKAGIDPRTALGEVRRDVEKWPMDPAAGDHTKHVSQLAWQRTIEAANRHYRPGEFTTFIAYEWTSTPGGRHLHRNVIFGGDKAPLPFTAMDGSRPEDLWNFLELCRQAGYEVLAIPHNPKLSDGLMFDSVDSDGNPIDLVYAMRRANNEPLVEIVQMAGQSETVPVLSPNDEFSDFEMANRLMEKLRNRPGRGYVRDALGRGLMLARRTGGANPYQYGFVGGTEFHNGLSDAAEKAYAGTVGAVDPTSPMPDFEQFLDRMGHRTPAERELWTGIYYQYGSGALTGVWAEQNTREAIFSALRRKETFATSGTRLQVRFFGGWGFSAASLGDKDWVKAAYGNGVSMGNKLPRHLRGKHPPTFVAWALKDPNGANLDRMQVVKVWLEGDEQAEQVYDVALSDRREINPSTGKVPPVGNTVNIQSATYSNTIGATELSAVWEDEQFDPNVPAVYYVRVLEIPTPRWSTILAVRNGKSLPQGVPATIQERGWSSPIWYMPEGQLSSR